MWFILRREGSIKPPLKDRSGVSGNLHGSMGLDLPAFQSVVTKMVHRKRLCHSYHPCHVDWGDNIGILNGSSQGYCCSPKAVFSVIQRGPPSSTTEEVFFSSTGSVPHLLLFSLWVSLWVHIGKVLKHDPWLFSLSLQTEDSLYYIYTYINCIQLH